MSQFIGAALSTSRLEAKDKRLVPNFQVLRKERDRIVERNSATEYPGGFYTAFWPGNRGFVGDPAVDVATMQSTWSRPISRIAAGVASRVGFPGVTRDEYGAPLAGVTVVLHRSTTRQFIHELVSDANGNYLMQSVYAGEFHYIYFHKPGAPNRWGATDNNLLGA